MRIIYPEILINYNKGTISKFFFKSLRFSTHCNYYFGQYPTEYKNFDFPYVRFDSENKNFDLKILFRERHFYFNKISSLNYRQKVYKYISKKSSSFLKTIKSCDFIRNSDGSFEYICSIDSNGLPIHDKLDIDKLLDYLKEKNTFPLHFKILSFNFYYSNESLTKVELDFNKVNQSWELYRLFGINVPLLLIQVFLGRNISTSIFIDRNDVIEHSGRLKLNVFNKKTYWFDLDETLICQNKPVKIIINFLQYLLGKGLKVSILTRHANNDINKTLLNIDLNPRLFSNIIHVKNNELKSSYVERNDFFIDNEYPQRFDVRSRTGAMVLDLDQIDFIDNFICA